MSKSTSNLSKQMLSIAPDALIELYEIDFSIMQENIAYLNDIANVNFGDSSIYRFCGMINGSNPIYWQGNAYQPMPIEAEGFEKTGDGKLPRPKLKIANPEGIFSIIFKSNKDFANCKVTRKRTYARFLDEENYLNRNSNDSGDNSFGTPDPDAHFPDDVFFINKKVMEANSVIEFELVSALELQDAYVPARTVLSSYCTWKYRCSIGCGYKGLPIETSDGVSLINGFAKNKNKAGDGGRIDSSLTFNKIPEWNRYGKNGNAGNIKGYSLGDTVKIVGKGSNNPYRITPSVFVCVQAHEIAKEHHPFVDKDHWLKDECSKTLDACALRFDKELLGEYNKSNIDSLPFGGFPGTEKFPVEG
jgi:lambda family phage minor tail protein L